MTDVPMRHRVLVSCDHRCTQMHVGEHRAGIRVDLPPADYGKVPHVAPVCKGGGCPCVVSTDSPWIVRLVWALVTSLRSARVGRGNCSERSPSCGGGGRGDANTARGLSSAALRQTRTFRDRGKQAEIPNAEALETWTKPAASPQSEASRKPNTHKLGCAKWCQDKSPARKRNKTTRPPASAPHRRHAPAPFGRRKVT